MKDASTYNSEQPDRRPDEWTVGYIAGLKDVFDRFEEEWREADESQRITVTRIKFSLADRLGLSNDARALLKLPPL